MKLSWTKVPGGKTGKSVFSTYITAKGNACVWRIMCVNSKAYDGEAYLLFMCPDMDVDLADQEAWPNFTRVMPCGMAGYKVDRLAMQMVQAMEDGIQCLMDCLPDGDEDEEEGDDEEYEEDDDDEEEDDDEFPSL